MFDRLARVVAWLYGQASRSKSRPSSANPEGAGHLSATTRAIGSDVPGVCPSPIALVLSKTCSGRNRSNSMQEGLILGATCIIPVSLISSRKRKWRQPGLAANSPKLVGWPELVRCIEGSQIHLGFISATAENRRAAAGAEMPPRIVACFAIDRHRILRENRGSVKERAVMLAAVETMAKADPVWTSRDHETDIAAQAPAGEPVHAPFLQIRDKDLQRHHRRRNC